MRDLNDDFIRANIDGEILPQIEAGLDNERSVQFYPFRASRPGVYKFVLDLDLSRNHGQLAGRHCLLQINAVVDRDARLQMGDVDKSRAQIFADAFEFAGSLFRGAGRPAFPAAEKYRE